MSGEFIRYEVADHIGQITIDRPEKKNAMTYAMLGEFIEVVKQAGNDAEAHVIILTGVPGAFCAGTDLADLATIPGADRGLRGSASDRDRWWPIVECGKPVIAAIDGPAVGMGAEFTVQCDVRLASPNARFAWNFVHRGLVPDTGAGSWLLPRLIGVPRALKLLYTGEFITAEQAHAMGYVDAVHESGELLTAARELAMAMRQGSPFSHARIKQLVYEGLGSDVASHMERHTEALAACFKSSDHAEGVAAFLERRQANFTGS